jgi:hypothetical protein
MNYTQLNQLIQEYCESTEQSFVANIPTFVQVAEKRIYNSVLIPALKKYVTGNMTAGFQYMTLPSDWLATYSMAVINPVTNEYEFLFNKDVNYIRSAYPTVADTGQPDYYAVWNPTTIILGPTPDLNYTTELHYFYYPESIVTAGTSWIGDNFEQILLYGCLREAYTYLKGEADLMQNYEAKYQEAMQQLVRLGDGLERGDAYRSGQPRIQPMRVPQ